MIQQVGRGMKKSKSNSDEMVIISKDELRRLYKTIQVYQEKINDLKLQQVNKVRSLLNS